MRKLLGRRGKLASTSQGAGAERAAERLLKREGYHILERNHRNACGEIDLIALEADTLCFVEVKLRTRDDFASPIESLSQNQQRRIRRAAELYLVDYGRTQGGDYDPPPCRFDFVSVSGDEGSGDTTQPWRVELCRDAF